MSGDLENAIRERAYEIWESEGQPQGRSAQHWEQARAELDELSATASAAPKASAGTSKTTTKTGRATPAKKTPAKKTPGSRPRRAK